MLGCDSMLAFDGEALGKPVDAADAVARWKAMRGPLRRTADRALPDRHGDRQHRRSGRDDVVHFADLSDEEIEAYVATGEPLHVAGAFTIDGLGGLFIERIEGDHGTVVGLSLPTLRVLMAILGVRVTDYWSGRIDDDETDPCAHRRAARLPRRQRQRARRPGPGPDRGDRGGAAARRRHAGRARAGALLTFLTRITGCAGRGDRHVHRLSSIAIARGLAHGGRLVCFDVSEEFTSMARRYWRRGGVDDRVELRIGPAAQTLAGAAHRAAPRPGLHRRRQDRLPRLLGGGRTPPGTGGLILVDNVLRHGHIIDPDPADEGTLAMVEFNRRAWPTTGSSR